MDNLDIENILENHLNDIRNLVFGDSNTAELLYQRTKMFSDKFFGRVYTADLIGLKFRVQFSFFEDINSVWSQNIPKLYAIAKAMSDDYHLNRADSSQHKSPFKPEIKYIEIENTGKINLLQNELSNLQLKLHLIETRKQRIRKDIIFWILLLVSSGILWSFNFFIHWQWLQNHPKRIAIYIALQILIGLFEIRIIKQNKGIDIATILVFIAAIITII